MIKYVQGKKNLLLVVHRNINFFREPSQSSNNNSRSSSPKSVAMVSSEYSIDVRANLDEFTRDEQQIKHPIKLNLDNDNINNNVFSILGTVHSVNNRMY